MTIQDKDKVTELLDEAAIKMKKMENLELLYNFVNKCENRDRIKMTIESEYYCVMFREILNRMGGIEE